MRALDLFCGAGGVAMGLHRAGFEVVGVDIGDQPNYPFAFVRGDALRPPFDLDAFDFIWASPPCQAYTTLNNVLGNEYPDLVAAARALLVASGKPYIIENVAGAPLHAPVMLCGTMFGLRLFRHRYFESNLPLAAPEHVSHEELGLRAPRTGRQPQDKGEVWSIYGHFSGVAEGRAAMGIDWYMTQRETAQAIPPAYSEFLGRQVERHIAGKPLALAHNVQLRMAI